MEEFRKELQRRYKVTKGVERAIYGEILTLLPKTAAPKMTEAVLTRILNRLWIDSEDVLGNDMVDFSLIGDVIREECGME